MSDKSGMFVFFDWLSELESIPPEDAMFALCALRDYIQFNKMPSDDVTGFRRSYILNLINQTQRSQAKTERISQVRRNAVNTRWNVQTNTNQYKPIQTNTNDTYLEHKTNTLDIEKEIYKEKETPKKVNVITERFERFWQAYPKKVAKATALKWFEKNKPSEDLTNRMIDAIESQRKSIEWTKDGGEFIPYPSTWLNQGRWEDELTPINNAPKTAENRSQQAKAHTEVNIPKYCTEDADDMFAQALRRTYGG